MNDKPIKTTLDDDPWIALKKYTDARIALGRAGTSLPTRHHLKFQLDHASAVDAVQKPIDWSSIKHSASKYGLPAIQLKSQARTRHTYLQRPDLGRKLSIDATGEFEKYIPYTMEESQSSACLVLVDGLSSFAIEENASSFLDRLLPALDLANITCDRLFLVEQGRVAIGDEIAQKINAKHLVLMIGERPGLSSPNSLGVYYTYAARVGCNDADRNCISNVRQGGQSAEAACSRLMWLINESTKLQYSGVKLKDESDSGTTKIEHSARNFLIE